ncbi:pilus assembly protein TadG-related protein [Hyphomicrobium sulfonivorans]|uniref:pilus assembly protein TadG-related protein n=1 Tax=Hyphomicrobium sulfonivorans TaxID=121290 RepID=UPI00156FB21B|nr:pilus assembly protein TadG-related protein [Hyphomicrobium sulfonivorans]MBI1649511.1 VWA domain-containing protein [Hyphomicrobium sulfonivorans]NSL71427.1 VWA domain-containing protein [Hyphomicrobium sulfonivorans]
MNRFWVRRAGHFGQGLRRFRRDDRGGVAIVFGLSILVVMLAAGAAIDFSRWLHARDKTLDAIDAAVLAGGRVLQTGGTETAALEAAKGYYDENVKSRLDVVSDSVSFTVRDDKKGISASGTAEIATPLLALTKLMGGEGISKLALISAAEAKFAQSQIQVGGNGGQSVEVSLILDITGSMSGSKIRDLKDAAKDLINTVIWDDQSEYYSKVALVPYAAAVNVGSSLATTARGSIKSGTSTTPGSQKFTFTNAASRSSQKTFSVSNCATERIGSEKFTDKGPSTAKVGLNYPASSNPCPTAQLVPLTKNKTVLNAAIDAYQAAGSTAGHIGVAWGWYTLSPNWNTVFTGESAPASYSKLTEKGRKGQPLLRKIAVLMTDGEFNTAYCNGVIAKDSGDGSGSDADHINCNASNGDSTSQALKLCTAMKATGIEVYTIGFAVGNIQAAKKLMNDCATDPNKVYIADNGDQLKQAFRDIALKMSSLYLSR